MASYHVLVALAVIVLISLPSHAAPLDRHLSRWKRVSDQRLAELEALLYLNRMAGKLVTVPVGFGVVDPSKVGRRKRSFPWVDNDYVLPGTRKEEQFVPSSLLEKSYFPSWSQLEMSEQEGSKK